MKYLIFFSLLGFTLQLHAREKNITKLVKDIKKLEKNIEYDPEVGFQGSVKYTNTIDGTVINYVEDQCYYTIQESKTALEPSLRGYFIKVGVGSHVAVLRGKDIKYSDLIGSYSAETQGPFYNRYFQAEFLSKREAILHVSKTDSKYEIDFYCTIR